MTVIRSILLFRPSRGRASRRIIRRLRTSWLLGWEVCHPSPGAIRRT
jgi:hypothetical protein